MIAAALALALPLALPHAASAHEPAEPDRAENHYRFADKASLDARLEEHRREYGAAALVAAMSRDGEVLYEGAFGWADRASATAAQMDTVFAMASVTKPMTATAIMMLVEEGKVDLGAPVNRYIPDHPVRAKFGRAEDVTVERVMRHTAGLPLVYDLVYEGEDKPVRDFGEMMDAHGYTVFVPGGRSEYSNLGYEILAEIIRRQSGMGYGEFLEKRLFAPLGMESAFISQGFDRPAHVATPYMVNGAVVPPVDTGHPGAALAHMSVRDLMRFGAFINAAWRGESPLLGQELVRKMTTPVEGDASFAGLGFFFWDFQGWHGVGHGGSMAGIKARINLFPEQNIVMAMATNLKEYELEVYTLEDMLRSFEPERMMYWKLASVPEDLVGTRWTGTIGGASELAEVEVDLTDAADPRVAIDGKPVPVRNMALDGRWTFRLDGGLDAAGLDFAHLLRFNLMEHEGRYVGEVRAEQRTGTLHDEGGVGYWVELAKAE